MGSRVVGAFEPFPKPVDLVATGTDITLRLDTPGNLGETTLRDIVVLLTVKIATKTTTP